MEKWNFFKKLVSKKGEIFVTLWIAVIAIIILYSFFLSSNETSRDAVRYTDLLKINDELKLYYSKNNTYPLPEKSVNITASWYILTYQWYAWEETFKNLWINSIKDPKTNKNFKYLDYYTYSTNEKKQKFQLMAFYEFEKNGRYSPLKKRIPFNYWDKVWIAIENKTERPIQETEMWVDVMNTLDSYSIYIDNKNVLIWDKLKLWRLSNVTPFVKTLKSQAQSCLDIKNAWWNETWFYYINPFLQSSWDIQKEAIIAYCDMESDWGWWTRIYYKDKKNVCYNWSITYDEKTLKSLFTKDFAVSDTLKSLKSEWSWIIKDINFKNWNFDFRKMTNVANCKAPNWNSWSNDYTWWFLNIQWKLSTLWTWNEMFYWCHTKKAVWNDTILRIWWFINESWAKHEWEFIHWNCNDYNEKDHSITSRWDWDNTRVIWVR